MHIAAVPTCVLPLCFLAFTPSAPVLANEVDSTSVESVPAGDAADESSRDHETASADDNARLGDVIVTARKRAQSSQEIGISLESFDGDALAERGADSIHEVVATIPNVKLFEVFGGGVPALIIRGVGVQDFRINNAPTAAFYVDEVYKSSVAMAGFMMFDLERIELLKGPQGGLYGRNTTAGAVRVISRRPEFGEPNGYFRYGIGRYTTQELESGFGAELSDDFAIRTAARFVHSDDTWSSSTATGTNHGEQSRWGARTMLLWRHADSLDALFKVHGGRDDSEAPHLRTVGTWVPGANLVPGLADGVLLNFGNIAPSVDNLCAPIRSGTRDNGRCASQDGRTPASRGLGDDVHDTLSSDFNELDNAWWGASTQFDWRRGDYLFTAISAFDNFDYRRKIDGDGLPEVYQHIDFRTAIDAWSQELRLAYNNPGGIHWLAGVSVSNDDLEEDTSLFTEEGLLPLAFDGANLFAQPYRQVTDAYAAYGQLEWPFADRLKLITALRYTAESKSYRGGLFLPETGGTIVEADLSDDFGDFSGKLGLEWKLATNTLLYGNISRGYKSGGFFGGFTSRAEQLEPYDSETIWAYELGYKGDFFRRTLRLNTAAFYYDYEDFQGFAQVDAPPAVIMKLTNLGDAEITGAEADLGWAPANAWLLQLAVGYLHGEIVDSDFTTLDSFAIGEHPLEGLNLPNYSKWTVSAATRYECTVSRDLSFAAQVEYAYSSEQDLNMISTPAERAPFRENPYALVNARLLFWKPDSDWTVSAWVENLTDEEYRTTVRPDAIGGIYELYGPPRSYGFTFAYQWQ